MSMKVLREATCVVQDSQGPHLEWACLEAAEEEEFAKDIRRADETPGRGSQETKLK